ncbi:FMN-dependent NADH-azoreductase [Thalassobacillus cyri]|uniref:FMN dependent NADH:quinone oxidoreductase n=1 Tax=Thalassobacillus cyri TaxID=571932 RepID=A0A1H4HH02_9BACI|nr:FMN-dependent NADH-azoreductase [Thalassobacillus cyri]SEB20916.1 FMN-dependent NADH-azoreductase [Thalassobacillus cyri]
MNVLVVKGNNRPDGITTKMYETFMEEVKDNNDLTLTTYDVFAEDMPYFGQDLFNALTKLEAGERLNDVEQRLLDAKQKAKDALEAADVIVLAFPLWNFTIPAKLHTFIDYVSEAGFTFKYTEEGIKPLMPGKKVILLNARGGVYSSEEMAPMEMSVNFMRNIFGGLYGMDIIDEVIIEGHNAMPDKAEEIVEEGMNKVKESARNLAYQYA